MRSISTTLLVSAAISLGSIPQRAIAQSPEQSDVAEIAAFNSAIERDDYPAAARSLEAVIDRHRPADGKPKHDPLIDAMSGRLLMEIPSVPPALTYLKQVKLNELPPGMRGATALAYAEALEIGGRRAQALRAFQDVLSVAESAGQAAAAKMGLARLQLIGDPGSAERTVEALPETAPTSWQRHAIIAAARSLRGDAAGAEQAADQAWIAAAKAPPEDVATPRVASIRAALASARNDRSAEQAMLAAAGGFHVRETGALKTQLPVCGDDGIRPDDFVTFAILAGPGRNRWPLLPVSASRPAIVAPFFDRIAGFNLIEFPGEVGGTVVTLACRTSISTGYFDRAPIENDLADWMIGRGLYPTGISNSDDEDRLARLGRKVDELEVRFGSGSPLLIYPRYEFMSLLQAAAATGSTVDPVQISRLSELVANGLRQVGAIEADAAFFEIESRTAGLMHAARDPEAARNQYLSLTRDFLRKQPAKRVRQSLQSFARMAEKYGMGETTDQLIVDVGLPLKTAFTGREHQAWLLTLSSALADLGRSNEAAKLLTEARLDPTTCAALVQYPKLTSNGFSYKDYPRRLVSGAQDGSVVFDFDIDVEGKVANPRRIISMPSGLFDDASQKGIATITYSPPLKNDRPIPCRGVVQSLVWKLEGFQDELPAINLTPLDLDESV